MKMQNDIIVAIANKGENLHHDHVLLIVKIFSIKRK